MTAKTLNTSDWDARQILPRHAHTIFDSGFRDLPYRSTSEYDHVLSNLASENALFHEVDFVWHGVNDKANLRQFLGSDVRWGEVDVRTDPISGALVLHHDRLYLHPETEQTLELEYAVRAFNRFDKSMQLDFKEGQSTVDRALDILAAEGFVGARLWFNSDLEVLGEAGYNKLRKAHPSSVVQCPIDSLVHLVLHDPVEARDILKRLHGWGISRFSVKWDAPQIKVILERISDWGFEVNIYNIPDLDVFLRMVLLRPRSITADFNFPEWHYFGRGAGQHGEYFHYSVRPKTSAA